MNQRLALSVLTEALTPEGAQIEGEAPAGEFTPASFRDDGDPLHVFTELDVAVETETSRRILCATRSMPMSFRAEVVLFQAAVRHRSRARAIARIIEEQERQRFD
jgi:hypothetical protein